MRAIFERKSTRTFSDRRVEEEKVEKLLRAAMAAPSAGNQQPWEFYVVEDKDMLEKISSSSPYAGPAKNAPFAIVVCYRKNGKFPECIPLDLSAASENILLEAEYLGLGAVWLAVYPSTDRMGKMKHILDLPNELEVFAVIPCGYAAIIGEKVQDRFDKARIHYLK